MQEKSSGAAKFLGDRLRQWRRSIPLKSFQLAKLIHISQGSLSDLENNKSLPSADTIAKLYQHTNISIIWLLTGKGSMRNGSQSGENDEEFSANEYAHIYGDDQTLRELMKRLVRIYQQGDSEKKAHLIGFLIGADPGNP